MLVEIPDLLERPEVKELRAIAAASEFVPGARTAGFRAKLVKHNSQMHKTPDQARRIEQIIAGAMKRNATFQRVAIPKRILPAMISRYEIGQNYGRHVDDALMAKPGAVRTDLAATIFLTDPTEYDGGELEVESGYGPTTVKLPAGAAVIYPATTIHRVVPLTRGQRLAAVTWIESHVRDPAKREILHDLDLVRRRLAKTDSDADETDLAFKTYANLLRMWAET